MKASMAAAVIATTLLTAPSVVFASMECVPEIQDADDKTIQGASCQGVPRRIYVYLDGTVSILASTTPNFLDGICKGLDNDYKSILLPDGPGKDRAYSTLLAAQLAGKSVYIRLPKDPANNCVAAYVYIQE